MKKIALSVGAVASMLLGSCSQEVGEKKLALSSTADSISYAVSIYMAQDMRSVMSQLEVDPEAVDDFVRGVRDGFPKNNGKNALAYSAGLHIGSRAFAMLNRAQQMVYGEDTLQRINPEIFLEGLVASIYADGKTMDMRNALEYYNRYMYRGENDKFMLDNAKREGVVTLPSGLQYKMIEKGNGDVATASDTVRCIYKGTFTNGNTFDSSRGDVVKVAVAGSVPGLSEALCLLPVGSRCKVYIPWQLAYGAEGSNRVPPYSTLVYDIEVLDVIRK